MVYEYRVEDIDASAKNQSGHPVRKTEIVEKSEKSLVETF
jgi:hypothetical protein